MSKEALVRREIFTRNATPVAAPMFDRISQAGPGLRSFQLPGGVWAIYIGSFVWFMAMMVATFSDGFGMPLVFAVCLFYGAMYFGVARSFARVETGDRNPDAGWDAFMRHGIDTGSGHLTGSAALAQIVTLPLLLAGFATFVALYV